MIIGIDPASATFGWAEIDPDRRPVRLGVLHQPRGERADHEGRVARVGAFVLGLATTPGVVMVACESLSIPRHTAGAVSIALAWGAVATACRAAGRRLVKVAPLRWQHACAGDGSASRRKAPYDKVIAELAAYVDTWGTPESRLALARLPKALRGHALDALGIALWAAQFGAAEPEVR